MKKIAFYGDETNGHLIVDTLRLLGAVSNKCGYYCTREDNLYFMDDDLEITAVQGYVFNSDDALNLSKFEVFTYNDFIEKFPYRYGQCVETKYGKGTIINVMWDEERATIVYMVNTGQMRYKNCYVDDIVEVLEDLEVNDEMSCDYLNSDVMSEDKFSISYDNDMPVVNIKNGFSLCRVDDNHYKIVPVETVPDTNVEYPKTYDDCLYVIGDNYLGEQLYLMSDDSDSCRGHFRFSEEINAFYKLMVCKKAYYEVCGKQLDYSKKIYTIVLSDDGELYKSSSENMGGYKSCEMFAFPTEKSRDEFMTNFEDDIKTVIKMFC